MKVLITAGGTREDIDSVRSIVNNSTGQLGSIIAGEFAKHGAEITYVCGVNAALPSIKNIVIIPIKNVQNLSHTLEEQLSLHKFDCVIHSMAVSDYTPNAVLSVDDVVANILAVMDKHTDIEAHIRNAIAKAYKPIDEGKISSKHPELLISLKQTPKIIRQIKTQQPDTVLVGFKLLSGVPEEELMRAAKNLLTKNSCNFVLANDQQNINKDTHKAILINKTGIIQRAGTKHEIAAAIYNAITKRQANQPCKEHGPATQ